MNETDNPTLTIKGIKGDKGDSIIGPKGDKGLDGRDGKDGINGLDGRDGRDGVDGKDGLDGRDGVDGKPGERGEQGIPGNTLSAEDIEKISKGLNKTKRENFLFANTGVNSITAGSGVTISGTTQDPIISASSSSSGDVVGPASAIDSNFVAFDTVTGKLIKDSGKNNSSYAPALTADENYVTDAQLAVIENTTGVNTGDQTLINEDSFGLVVDGGGTALTTGSKGYKYIPWDCTVTGWSILSDISGSVIINVKRAGVSLAGTEKPTLSSASNNSNLALSTWTTSLLAGDVIEFVIDSASTLTRATLTILVTKV